MQRLGPAAGAFLQDGVAPVEADALPVGVRRGRPRGSHLGMDGATVTRKAQKQQVSRGFLDLARTPLNNGKA